MEALRSGKFQQTQFYLENNGKYCCLGVLCKLAADEGIVEQKANMLGPARFSGSVGFLPFKVMEWSGIKTNFGLFKSENGFCNSLQSLNDTKKVSFDKIADIIEQNVEGL